MAEDLTELTSKVKEKLKLKAGELKVFTGGIRSLAEELLPAVPEEEPEGGSLAGELLGMMECLLADDLDPAIRKLEGVDDLGPAVPPERERGKESGS
jgi:hypothetical protein